MKLLDNHNINELSKILYKTNVMPSGDSKSFVKLSKKLIIKFQEGYSFDKIKRVLSSELIANYGLSVTDKEVQEIAELVESWCRN